MLGERLFWRHGSAFGHRHPEFGDNALCEILVHGKRRRQNAGMSIGYTKYFEHALDAAIFTPATVQGVKADMRF